jgi:hypothetical protein
VVVDVRSRPLVGERFYLVKWKGFDGDMMEESTWEPAASLAETALGTIDDF